MPGTTKRARYQGSFRLYDDPNTPQKGQYSLNAASRGNPYDAHRHTTTIDCSLSHSQFLSQRDYYANSAWQHPSSIRESCSSDFVPGTYKEHTFITKLYHYARTLLSHTNGSLLQRGPFSFTNRNRSSNSSHQTWSEFHSQSDFEMITSTPSPTLHAGIASSSPTSPYLSRTNNGRYRYPQSISPHPPIKTSPAAIFSQQISHSPASASNPQRHSLSASAQSAAPAKVTVDVGTQYSPPIDLDPPSGDPPFMLGKRRGMSKSPKTPPEPALEPQPAALKHNDLPSSYSQTATASSVTLAKTSSEASSSSQGSSPKRSRQANSSVKYMPEQYETCDVKDLVVLISNMLMELVRFNDDIPLKDGRLTRFHSRAPPGISVKDYLQRLATHATLSPPILLSMVYYIDRLCALYPAFTISSLTVHRFLITSATVASKGLSDSFWTNNTYARVGGVSLKELALLELEFLWRVEWRIVPKPEVLVDYYRSLVERSEGYKIKQAEVDQTGSTSKESG